MEKTDGYNRKIFHRICITILTALFAILIITLLLQGGVDEAAFLHTAGCGMIMVMDVILAASYSAGNYEVTDLQDRIYMTLLILVSVSLLGLGVYRLAFFDPAYYYLDPFIVQICFILTAFWISLFGLFDLTFFKLPRKRLARIRTLIIVFSALFIVLVVTDPLTGFLIGKVEQGGVTPGPLYFLWWVFSLGSSVWYSVMILKFTENRQTKLALLIFEVHAPLWVAIDFLIGFQRSGYITFSFLDTFISFLSLFVIFCVIYIENSRKLRENEMELTQSRLNALQLQMDPHFMANALNALSVLTDTDPKAAKRMIANLSDYLRGNFYDPDGNRSLMIPFPEELERLERYLAIERIRFCGIRVDYWLETEDFEIPAMTLQPLVENAIKYGICKKEHSEGSIEIRSLETQEAYMVIIQDDGVGFDERKHFVDSTEEDHKKHIGIPNTRKRLELMCGGSLTIHSTPGKGTVCKISIPKQGT